MKHLLFFILIILSSNLVFSKKTNEIKSMDETYRNQFHFSTEYNRLGSPIAIWQIDSIYHLYFQHNSENLIDGFYNWSHATSSDLLKWDFQEMVLVQPSSETDSMKLTPWWGSVSNYNNEANAWVNRWGDGIYQTQSKNGYVWSDELKTVGTDSLKNSEPYVFWHEPTLKWVMLAFDRSSTNMYILNSVDGLNWIETSSFNYNFGFPQFIELPVDRKPDDTRWVMITEKGTYMIGNFDGEKFSIETTIIKNNNGKQIGGTIIYNDKNNNRTIALSGIKCEQQADLGSNGFLSFPTEISLHEHLSGIELHQKPIDEIKNLYLKTQTWEEKKIYPGLNNNIVKKVKGTQLHIKGVIDILNCDQFGFIIRSDKNRKGTEITYNVKKKIFGVINTQFDYEPKNNKIEFEMLIDRSSIEFFIDGGRYVTSSSFSPSPESLNYELFCSGGEIMVDWLEVHQLKSVWNEE